MRIHAYIHTCIHTYIHTYILMRAGTLQKTASCHGHARHFNGSKPGMYACMHVCMYVKLRPVIVMLGASMHPNQVCMHVCMYACMHVCKAASCHGHARHFNAPNLACMHVCMYVLMCMYARNFTRACPYHAHTLHMYTNIHASRHYLA